MTTEVIIDDKKLKDLFFQLKGLVGKVAKVGWNEKAKYPDVPGEAAIPATAKSKGRKATKGKKGEYVAYIAAIQEFGDTKSGIPARSFIRRTVREKTNEWSVFWTRYSNDILAGKYTMNVALEGFGLLVKGQIQQTITSVFEPPLKPATIAARLRKYKVKNALSLATKYTEGKVLTRQEKMNLGSLTKPLEDTGYMRSSIYNTVENE